MSTTIGITTTAASWDLAVAEIAVYGAALLPMGYVAWRHRRPQTGGWLFLAAFLLLQVVGAGLIVSSGKGGQPSTTGLIISGVGLSPQLLGLAGIVQECAHLADAFRNEAQRALAVRASVFYHLVLIAAVAIYAVGQSRSFSTPPGNNARGLAIGGIILLLILWVLLVLVTAAAASAILRSAAASRRSSVRTLFFSVCVALMLIGVRVVYQTVATVSKNHKYSPVGGDVAYPGALQFMPSALLVIVMIIGGFVSRNAYESELGGLTMKPPTAQQYA